MGLQATASNFTLGNSCLLQPSSQQIWENHTDLEERQTVCSLGRELLEFDPFGAQKTLFAQRDRGTSAGEQWEASEINQKNSGGRPEYEVFFRRLVNFF